MSGFHYILSFFLLLLLLVTVLNALFRMSSAKEVSGSEELVYRFCFWFAVVQSLIGLGLYISKNSYIVMVNEIYAYNPHLNFIGKTHLFVNVTAMAAMIIGYRKFIAPQPASTRLKSVAFYYSAALALMLAGIQWSWIFA